MFSNLDGDVPDALESDVVILGSGAAGTALAATLARKGRETLLLEAGGANRSKKQQDFYAGDIVDPRTHPWIDRYRLRALGGSTKIWGGRCIPLDPIDFEKRAWVPLSGWPIPFEALAPYFVAAVPLAEAGRPAFRPADALPGALEELAPGLDGDKIATTIERFSKPSDFWKIFGEELTRSPNARVLALAPAVAIRLHPDGKAVDHIEVVAANGRRVEVRGKTYVVAMGGLESARLLMASNDVARDGIGNHSDWLGRTYMSHLCMTAGTIHFAAPFEKIGFDYQRDADGVYCRRRLWIREETQRELGLLNTTFRTHLPDPADPTHGNAILSAMFLVKSLVLYEYGRKFQEKEPEPLDYLRHVGNIARQPLALARFGIEWVQQRNLADRKIPSVVLPSPSNAYSLEFHAEQAPYPDSRLTLSHRVDAYGVPRLRVDWRVTPLDIESVKQSYRVLAAELERSGAGRLAWSEDELESRILQNAIVGGHHIGATRMSADPASGVVDVDCKVHGVSNLYVASSSVMPTSGQANPTLTIIALALRLADHLGSTQ
jgi:choline dehydrogenase-like flavoprotein